MTAPFISLATRLLTPCVALACVLIAAPASGHHPALALGTVNIPQPVMAGDQMIQPGTYELRLTGEHRDPLPGQSENALQEFELIAGGTVAARGYAEVLTDVDRPIGTSGGAGTRPRVHRLRGGEFLRISVYHGEDRYLIHLALR